MMDAKNQLLWIDDQDNDGKYDDYISGGKKAKKAEFPFMVAIGPCSSKKGKKFT